MKINEKLRQLREIHSLSQEEVADKLKMSVAGYGKIERGEVRTTLPRLEQIAEIFELDICELLAYGENEKIYFNNTVSESTHSNNFLFAVGNENLEQAIKQLQLMISYKDEIIANLKRENKLLLEMNELLKKQS